MILVTGGAGYIGSHVTKDLLDKGFSVLVLDNLSTGNIQAVDKRATFIYGDIGDDAVLTMIFQTFKVEAVMHFAASCLVGESVEDPLKYYLNNVSRSIHLIDKMIKFNVKKMVFSSTCATYGVPKTLPITEETPATPINPYGSSKLMIESILKEVSGSNGLSYIALRYFNVAGADISGEIGENHNPETHLIPNILKHLQGKTDYIEVYGNRYDTPDGTCIRDYIHVSDLAKAHILALEYLLKSGDKINEVFNLGSERGYSVFEIIRTCEQITGKKANIKICPGRNGDPAQLIASSDKIKEIIGWKPCYNLNQIIKSAWNWHQKRPEGYM